MKGHQGTMRKNLYFTFVILIELAIMAAFIWFLVYLFPTLDPKGYLFYGDAPHVPYLEQQVGSTPVTVVRWAGFLRIEAVSCSHNHAGVYPGEHPG